MEKGVELIRKCSKVRLWSSCKQYKYRDKLMGLDESLQKLLNILKVQVARDVKETLVSVKNIEAVIQKIEGSGLVQDQIQTKGWGALPEPLSPRVGLDLVNVQGTRDVKETLVSARNTKVVVDKIEGSGVVQNQRASEYHSRNIDSNASRSRGSEFSEAVTRRMDKSQGDGKILETSNLRIFSFSELKAATRNFSRDTMVGEGEYGRVFKGWVYEKTLAPSKAGSWNFGPVRMGGEGEPLPNGAWMDELAPSKVGIGSPVAIKKLNPGSAKGFQDWQSVVNFLGKLSHPSLVKLLGYCWEENDLLLVYEFMPRGSLENYIFRRRSSTEPLSWDSRLKIAIGAARGLAFLHTSEVQIIYRDFKTSNILLDENYNARISDFGVAELGPIFVESHVSTRIVGTYAYAAPEYFGTGHVTTKSNVYCFGGVLLEILTGFQALDRRRPIEQQNLVEWAKPLLSHETKLKTIMDPGIEGQCSLKAALQTAQIIQKCPKLDPKSRPSMKEVVEALEHVQEIKE